MDEKDSTILEYLFPGTNVNIKRTDGRVHSAIISAINFENESVTVEWFEKGETKGKEIEIENLFILNPDLLVIRNRPNTVIRDNSQQNISSQNRLTRDSSSSSEDASTGLMHMGVTFSQHKISESNSDLNSNQQSSYTATITNSSQTCLPVPSKGKGSLRVNRNGKPESRPTVVNSTNGYNEQDRRETAIIPPSTAKSTITSQQTSTATMPNALSVTSNAKNRRSNVVKEVEKLKKNREERRQRQAEEKAEKEAFLSQAPGNPYWEFLNMVQEYQRTIEFKPITVNDIVGDHQITVCVRKRPLNKKEMARKEVDVISVPNKDTVIVHEPKNKVDLTKYLENQFFRFDYAFDETCSNELVYKFTAQPLVLTIFEGGMATCFAYGQTGSGKTHTMGGDFHGKTQDCNKGIYALVAKDVFRYLKSPKYNSMDFVVAASFFEIYSGKVFDLLNQKSRLRILEDGKQQVQVVGLTERVVQNVDEVLKIIQLGNNARTSGQTSANSNSSRSHAVFQITLRPPGMSKIHGKFSLIDLAGNERGADTSSANRTTRMEGAEINKSLLALKECIRALGKKSQTHLPFRASKLTQVLRDSFIGEKSRTCMIAMISPNVSSCEHSLNTLRYADRVKELAVNDPELRDDSQEGDYLGGNMQEDADLLTLKSMNESEMPDDMLNFHKMMSDLQAAEEAMVENHKLMNEFFEQMLVKSKQLYNRANTVDYDQDAYSQELEELMDISIEKLKVTGSIVQEFRGKLYAEEQLSRSMKS